MRFLKAIRECSSYFRKQSPEAISEGTISWQNCFWLSAGNCQKCAKIKFDSAGQAFLHKKTRLKMWKNACLTPYNDILLYFWFLLETNIILREKRQGRDLWLKYSFIKTLNIVASGKQPQTFRTRTRFWNGSYAFPFPVSCFFPTWNDISVCKYAKHFSKLL